MDEVNKNIPISTPCPSFFQEEEDEEEKAVRSIVEKEINAVETLVNLPTTTTTSKPEETEVEEIEEEEFDYPSENENESTTTPSPVPIALPNQPKYIPDHANSPLNTPVLQQHQPVPDHPNSPLDTPVLQQHQPVIIANENNTLFSSQQQLGFSPTIFPPTQDIEEILAASDPIIQPYMPNKNDCYVKSGKGGKNVNFMRQMYENEIKMAGGNGEECDDDDNDDDDDGEKKAKSELRQTTKNNRRFHKTLYLKKKK